MRVNNRRSNTANIVAGRHHNACEDPAHNLLNHSGLELVPRDGAGAVGVTGRSVRLFSACWKREARLYSPEPEFRQFTILYQALNSVSTLAG